MIETHAAFAEVHTEAETNSSTRVRGAQQTARSIAAKVKFPAELTSDLHVLPYFHGNRSPRADATLRGMVAGLSLSSTIDDLALLYLATIQAIAHGTRHIIDTMNAAGYRIRTILACGGGTKNPVFLRDHANITACKLVLPREPEAVLLGAAVLGAVAARKYGSVPEAMGAMNSAGKTIEPATGEVRDYHERKHRVFLRMYDDLMAYRQVMSIANV